MTATVSLTVTAVIIEELVVEVGDNSGTHRNGDARLWKPLPSNGYWRLRKLCAALTVNFGLYNWVGLKQIFVVTFYTCPINPITSLKTQQHNWKFQSKKDMIKLFNKFLQNDEKKHVQNSFQTMPLAWLHFPFSNVTTTSNHAALSSVHCAT